MNRADGRCDVVMWRAFGVYVSRLNLSKNDVDKTGD
jgi:hypothetical protein